MVICVTLWVKQLQLCAMSSTAYSHSDADVLNQSLLEANIATEVCLTVLDTLSVFIMGFKVQCKAQVTVVGQCFNRTSFLIFFFFFSPADPAVLGPRPQPADEEGV